MEFGNGKLCPPGHRHLNHARIDCGIVDGEYGIHCEEYFQEILCLERKRSERSGKPLVLTSLGFEKEAVYPPAATRRLIRALAPGCRDTDVIGWLVRERAIGVIFTDLAEECVESALRNIDRKLRETLSRHLAPSLLERISIAYQLFPEKFDQRRQGEQFNMLFYRDVLRHDAAHRTGDVAKRALDIAGSCAGLLLFSPLFLVIAVMIKATSKGPVLFRQQRYGQYAGKFVFLKFRTMYVDNDDAIHRAFVSRLIAGREQAAAAAGVAAGGAPVYKITNDPRVTPLGRFLRRSSLDELPQFINVLRGEMSLVGPRPPIPYELENYHPWHRHRLLGRKPGLTGLWQVKGRSSSAFDAMVRLDLQYIRDWSLWLDIKLICQTPLAVLRGKGAY